MIMVRCELGSWGGRTHSYAGSSSNSSKDSSISSRSVKEEEGLELFIFTSFSHETRCQKFKIRTGVTWKPFLPPSSDLRPTSGTWSCPEFFRLSIEQQRHDDHLRPPARS